MISFYTVLSTSIPYINFRGFCSRPLSATVKSVKIEFVLIRFHMAKVQDL